jgi:hypothetical protein
MDRFQAVSFKDPRFFENHAADHLKWQQEINDMLLNDSAIEEKKIDESFTEAAQTIPSVVEPVVLEELRMDK